MRARKTRKTLALWNAALLALFVAIAVGVALYAIRGRLMPNAKALALLNSLKSDATACLSASSSSLPTIDLLHLEKGDVSSHLQGLRCPVILLGALEYTGVSQVTDRWIVQRWRHMRQAVESSEVVFDAHPQSPTLTYWDNNTALAATVRQRGVASQGYTKIRSTGGVFLDEVVAPSGRGALGWVRFGSNLQRFSPKLCRELRVPRCLAAAHIRPSLGAHGGGLLSPLSVASASETTDVLLWIAAAGVTSTAHYDRWDNTHVVVAGRKRVTLTPPSLISYAQLGVRPGTHPHARQARASTKAGLLTQSVTLEAGMALFIPSGWLHEVVTLEPSVALSVTTTPSELDDFTQLTAHVDALAPFLARWEAAGQDFEPPRMVAALRIFVPHLLAELKIDPAELHDAMLASYAESTRHEAGLGQGPHGEITMEGATGNMATRRRGALFCQKRGWQRRVEAERAALQRDAVELASRLRQYRPEVLGHYVLLYMDALLSKVGGFGEPSEVLANMLRQVVDQDPCGLFAPRPS